VARNPRRPLQTRGDPGRLPGLAGRAPAVWLCLLTSADHEIAILDDNGLLLADQAAISALADKARAGVRVRGNEDDTAACAVGAEVRDALGRSGPLRAAGVQFRLHTATLYQSIYRADGQLLVAQHAYGIPATRAPILRLRATDEGSEMITAYLESFERIWATAREFG
jgi:hypothetical protein